MIFVFVSLIFYIIIRYKIHNMAGSWADTQRPRDNIGYDIKIAM